MAKLPLKSSHVRRFLTYSMAALVVAVAAATVTTAGVSDRSPAPMTKADRQAEADSRRQTKRMHSLFDHIIWICLYAFLSAVFAGLTLGVMCADTFTLEIIAESGPAPDCKYAATILPLRKQGHKTLCTLIVSNMLCNVLIVQQFSEFFDIIYSIRTHGNTVNVVDDSGSPLLNFLLSTSVIVIFAEILPMSICKSKYSLKVAAAGSIFVKVAMIVTYPVSAPLGVFLDWVVGSEETGQIYDRKELRKLMVLHYNQEGDNANMPTSELNLLLAAMDFQERRVKDIMTPIESATFVKETETITPDFVERIWLSGRSRVPVESAVDHCFCDVLVVKDLLTVNISPDEEPLTVAQVTKARNRLFAMVGENTTLPAMMKFFQDAKTHMAVVFAEDHETGIATAADNSDAAGLHDKNAAAVTKTASISRHSRHEGNHARLSGSDRDEDEQRPLMEGVGLLKNATAAVAKDDFEKSGGEFSSSIRCSFGRQAPHMLTQGHVRTVGIVTMEDVVEELLNDEIYDEYDRYEPEPDVKVINEPSSHSTSGSSVNRQRAHTPTSNPRGHGIVLPEEPRKQPRVNFHSYFTHPEMDVPLTDAQVWAVVYFLNRTVKAFMLWPPAYIKLLLDDCGDEQLVAPAARRSGSATDGSGPSSLIVGAGTSKNGAAGANVCPPTPDSSSGLAVPAIDLRSEHTLENSQALSVAQVAVAAGSQDTPTGRRIRHYDHVNFLSQAAGEEFVMYAMNKPAECFTLVLGGQVDMLVGSEKFYSRLRSFQFIAEEALTESFYAPDFSAIVSRAARVYRISKDRYERFLSYQTVRHRLQSNLRVLRTSNSAVNFGSLGAAGAAAALPPSLKRSTSSGAPTSSRTAAGVAGCAGRGGRGGRGHGDDARNVAERDSLLGRTFSEGAMEAAQGPRGKAYGTFSRDKY